MTVNIPSFLNAKPEAPSPVQPQHEGAVPLGENSFSWSKSEGISSYHFQLSKQLDFSQLTYDFTNNKGASASLPEPLAAGKWYWRVAAIDEQGVGPFGKPNQFRVMKPGPEAEAAAMSDTDIGFRWAEGADGDQYHIQIAKDANFEQLIVDETLAEPNYKLSREALSGDIYMRTKVIESDGFEGSWNRTQIVEMPEKNTAWMALLPFLLLIL